MLLPWLQLSACTSGSASCQCAALQGSLFGLPAAQRMQLTTIPLPEAAAYDAEVAHAVSAARAVLPRLTAVVLPACSYTHKCLMGLALILAGSSPSHF